MSIVGTASSIPERSLRALLIWLSHRRMLGRAAMRTPVTRPMVGRFVAGESLDEALSALAGLRDAGMHTTVDVLGESVLSFADAEAAASRYVETLDALADRGLDRNASLKLTQMGLDVGRDACLANVDRIARRAAELGAFLRIDMEEHTKTDATLDVWRHARSVNPATGIVIQAALRRSAADVDRIVAEGGRVRLCKGAYLEPASVAFPTKPEVDASYVRLMEVLLRDGDFPALATHDPRIIAHAIAFTEREKIGPERFEFQMLYGIRRDLQEQLVRRGFGVRVYVPYGTEWYPYFMRRLAERPANVLFMLRSLTREGIRRRPTAD